MGDHQGDQTRDKVQENGDSRVDHDIQREHDDSSGRMISGNKIIYHWLFVLLSIFALVGGQCSATLLSRFYFEQGGSSRWLQTLVPCVGWPILIPPLVICRLKQSFPPIPLTSKLVFIYVALGLLTTADNLLYSWGISFLPVSTFSLLCSSQLAFNAVFAYFLVQQKIGPYVLNSIVLLTFSAVLLGIHSSSDKPERLTTVQFTMGLFYTILASAIMGLLLPLMQLVFNKVSGQETITAVLEMQIYTSIVVTLVCILGFFFSGDSRIMKQEAAAFKSGKLAYSMTLVWSAIGWQIHSVGLIGLISVVSSLFSNVISTVTLPVVPILAVGLFHERMDALKIMALLLGMWGFVSYVFGEYMDSNAGLLSEAKKSKGQSSSLKTLHLSPNSTSRTKYLILYAPILLL